jgi:acetyltransferase-like isoleucine patch superfamily enzyme
VIRLLAGGYRVVWRALTVGLLVWRARLVAAIWGADDAAHLIAHARKHAIVPVLRGLGAAVAPDADIEPGLVIHNAANGFDRLTIGPGCHIGKDTLIDLSAPVILEARCTLSMRVTLVTHIDVGQSPLRNGPYPVVRGPVTIAEGAYIGASATVLHGVRVGRCAVVAAGAVVRQDTADYTVVGGIPARVLKQLDPSTLPGESKL